MHRPQRNGVPLTYSEIMRVVGNYADRAAMRNLRILETDEGLILQGEQTRGEHAAQVETYQLTPEDIEALVWDAYARRGKKM